MSNSVHYDVQVAVQTLLKAAEFDGLPAANIVVRMLPKASEQLQKIPAIIVAPHGEKKRMPGSFEGSSWSVYMVEVCIVDANNLDMKTNQQKYQEWQGLVEDTIFKDARGEFRTTLASVPTIWNIEIESSPTFDRSKLNNQYAYQSVLFKFHSYE